MNFCVFFSHYFGMVSGGRKNKRSGLTYCFPTGVDNYLYRQPRFFLGKRVGVTESRIQRAELLAQFLLSIYVTRFMLLNLPAVSFSPLYIGQENVIVGTCTCRWQQEGMPSIAVREETALFIWIY